jgi:hypothetical protein
MEPPNVFVLFLLGFATDALWCSLTKAVNNRLALRSSAYSMALEGLKLAAAWIVIRNDSIAGAFTFILGCGFGTYFSARWDALYAYFFNTKS